MTHVNQPNTPAESRWYHEPRRILQTVLREIDAPEYDADAVVAHMKEVGYDTLVVNAGGIFDFFPSPLPFANPVKLMGERDILAEISSAVKAAGFRIITRVDFRGVERSRYDEHPEWFAAEPDGAPVVGGYNSVPLYAPCYTGRYRNEHATAFIDHILSTYPIDGIWHNSVHIGHTCYCETCRDDYRAATGHEIPIEESADDAAMERYWDWKAEKARANLTVLRGAVKNHGDDKAYVAEVFSMFDVAQPRRFGIDLYEAATYFDFLVSVAFLTANRPGAQWEPLSYAGSITRFLKALEPRKRSVILHGSNGNSFRYIGDPPQDLRTWLWEAASLGGSHWNCVFNGVHPGRTVDRRNAAITADVNSFLREFGELTVNSVPVTDALVYYSKPSKDMFGNDDIENDLCISAIRGAESALIDSHVQYGFAPDAGFDGDTIAGARLLILPNVICLSDHDCAIIREYVERGGSLLATHLTSGRDETGRLRDGFGLADVFGVTLPGRSPDDGPVLIDSSYDCYQFLAQREHPVLSGIADTELIMNGGTTVRVSAHNSADIVATTTAVIRNQPPEKAWVDDLSSGSPTIIARRFGNGRVVYCANQLDRLIFTNGHPDFRTVYTNAVAWLSGGVARLTTNAPASVHVALLASEKTSSYVVSLVNHTSHAARPLSEIAPVRAVVVRVTLPAVGVATRVLRSASAVRARLRGREALLEFDELHEFSSVEITYARESE